MPKVIKSARVPYSQEQMFLLVNDVRTYPEFLPFCHEAEIISQDGSHLEARLTFSKGGVHKSFTTRNQLTPYVHMDVQLIDGPFSYLEGKWEFIQADEMHTDIHFELDYEFNNKLLALMFGPLFAQMTNTLVDSFIERATVVYEY